MSNLTIFEDFSSFYPSSQKKGALRTLSYSGTGYVLTFYYPQFDDLSFASLDLALNGIRTTKLISPSTLSSTETPQLGIRAGLQGHSVKAGGGQDSKEAATKHHMDWHMVTGVYATSPQLILLLTRFILRTRTRAVSFKIKHSLVAHTQTLLTVIELYQD